MSINSLIINTLNPLGMPVAFLIYSGTVRPYLVFNVIDERSHFLADNVEKATEYTVQVDVYHTGNYTSQVDAVKQAMIAAGFSRLSEYDLYEPDTAIYHKAIRFFYYEEV